MAENGKGFEEWAVLELMGHQQIAGLLSEQEIAGHALATPPPAVAQHPLPPLRPWFELRQFSDGTWRLEAIGPLGWIMDMVLQSFESQAELEKGAP